MAGHLRNSYLLFLFVQLYALIIHFPDSSGGSVFTRQLQLVKILTTSAILLSFFPVSYVSAHSPAAVSYAFTAPAYVGLLGGTFLFLWAAYTSGPRNFAIIFSRVTPQFVTQTGPFAWIRHPTYFSYVLGWLGAFHVCLIFPVVDRGAQFWIPAGVRQVLLGACIAGLCKCYSDGAKMEEKQFLEGENTVEGEQVPNSIKAEYRRYVERVKSRWIPGIV